MRLFFIGLAAFVAVMAAWLGFHHAARQSSPASSTETSASNTPTVAATPPASAQAAASAVDLHAIPLGDGKVSTAPEAGYVYSCQTTFSGGGADHAGGWIHGSTWDLSQKVSVEGEVTWPEATFSDVVQGTTRLISGNGLPVNEPTGTFPIARTDPAYQYDRNPNSIQSQHISYALPASPAFAAQPSCVPMGPVGIALDGVAIYNALDDGGRDAVAHEVQDSCNGHPQSAGQYHYHGPSPCMPNVDKRDTVIGYALDGFPITSLYDAKGRLYTDSELDACHGTTGTYTDEKGVIQTGYHYVLTQEYPYTIGCFRGTPIKGTLPSGGAHSAPNSGTAATGAAPPAAAVAACSGKVSGASCTINGNAGTCRTTPDGSFACVP